VLEYINEKARWESFSFPTGFLHRNRLRKSKTQQKKQKTDSFRWHSQNEL